MRLRRRDLLRGSAAIVTGGALTAAVDGLCLTPFQLDVSLHRLGGAPPDSASIPSGDAAATSQPGLLDRRRLRIAHLSDLHLRSIGSLEERVLAELQRIAPDLLVITGDSISSARGEGALREFLAACPDVPHRLAILGNWEITSGVPVERLRAHHERHGFDLLVNRSVRLAVGDRSVRVTGFDDIRQGRPDPVRALAGEDPCDHHLVLAHCPVHRDKLDLPAEHPADLVLSGHTHGGQVAPGGVALLTPPGSGRYVAGWYRDGGPPLFVSRGIGTSTVPIRIGSVPEVACIDWHLA
jgi:predicted MPP superfamily phosphohydrolase